MIVWVKEITWEEYKNKDGTYMMAKLINEEKKESTKRVFKEEWQETFQIAHDGGLALEIETDDSKYRNLISVTTIAQKLSEQMPDEPTDKAPRQDIYLTNDQQRNRSMAVSYTLEHLVATGKIELKDWKSYTDQFRQYIEGEIIK